MELYGFYCDLRDFMHSSDVFVINVIKRIQRVGECDTVYVFCIYGCNGLHGFLVMLNV